MSAIISIPTPCHEDWNLMSPQEQGRHCDVCCKTVVDFTSWQPQEILFYMQQNASKKVCGRFFSDQLNEPIPTPEDFVKQLHHFAVPFLKKAAAILLFAFSAMMVSCNDNNPEKLSGQITAHNYIDTPPHITGDSTVVPIEQGEPAMIEKPVKQVKPKTCTIDVKGDVAVLTVPPTMGIVAVEPLPPVIDTPRMIPVAPVADKPDKEVIMGKMIATPVKKPATEKKQH